MSASQTSFLLGLGVVLLFIATPVAAFGAGDIVDVSNIDGVNYRHGDIENTLLELIITAGSNTKFEKLDIKRVYFGNWLRDYSQAIDVGGLKQLPADTIRILLWCLSFITFGYATDEFEVTAERLGCYRPEEHIDNPKDYADNEDARPYDSRLRGPVDEAKELAIDKETGLKVYIASENAGIQTSAALVRKLFEKSIELGRKHHKDNNDKNAFFEALRLLGTGLHCLEDYSAHSNYTELALKELGVDAFPHVGKKTEMDVKGKKIFPLVTGTFGMTDFLHSVVGELGDKVAQSEVEAMESKLTSAEEEDAKNDEASILKAIMDKIPWDMLEGDDAKPDAAKADELKAAAAKKAEESKNNAPDPNVSLGGVDIEEAKRVAQQTLKDMYPILEFSDQVNKAIAKITSKVPGLDELRENIMGALSIFIFSLLSPYVKPIIAHARVELKSTSEGVLKSSMKGQYEVFENETCTDPTHSMLSKDHFSNVLNPVAGQIACATVKFVVPLIVEAWSDEGKDVRQVCDEVLQVFHHPALRDENKKGQKAMFETVKKWWEDKDETEKNHFKEILSFDGVKDGKNHEGEHNDGHSHGAPVKKNSEAQEGATLISGLAGGFTNMVLEKTGMDKKFGIPKVDTTEHQQTSSSRPERTEEKTEESSYSRPERKEETQGSSYGQTSSYGRKDDSESTSYGGNTSSYGRQDTETETPSYGSGRHGRKNEEETESSGYGGNTSSYGRKNDEETESSGYGRNTSSYGRQEETSSYGGGNTSSYGRNNDNETSSYGGGNTSSYSRQEETSYGGRQEETSSYGGGNTSSYGRGNDEETSYGSGRHGRGNNDEETEESSYGSRRRNDESEETSYGSSRNTYGQSDETEGYGGGNRRY